MSRALRDEPYVSLTTRRRTGAEVATAVWAAPDEQGRLLVWTGRDSGKVKRIRHTAAVTVAACDRRGTVTGPAVPGTARLVPEAELPRVTTALTRKYRWQFRAFAAATRVAGRLRLNPGQVGLEITLGPSDGGPADGGPADVGSTP